MEKDYSNYEIKMDDDEIERYQSLVAKFGNYRGQVGARINGRQIVGALFGDTLIESFHVAVRDRKQQITGIDMALTVDSYNHHNFSLADLVAW